jgi:CarboxypepD_reg-like domain
MEMMRAFFLFIITITFGLSQAQTFRISGIVTDSATHEALPGATIILYETGNASGAITNAEGKFSIGDAVKPDSIIFSMIGYQNRKYGVTEVPKEGFFTVSLKSVSTDLREVVVRPLKAIDIVRQAARKMSSFIPSGDFESNAFYREIIRDGGEYYSVAEAIFDAQFSVKKKSFKLKLEKGRSKEDVAYTKLFEDFHPGGGPEDAAAQSLSVRQPDFLSESRLKDYNYRIDSTVIFGDNLFYVISFDQKPALKEALEKGYLYIDVNDYSPLKFEAWNSPIGTPYIKSLKGSDKIFAEILHIDLTIKGWERIVTYTKIGGRLFLSYAKMDYNIGYRQPKKELDLNLQINTEFVVTDFQHPIVREINKEEEWKRKNLVANLPTDFDAEFWGKSNILDPTVEVNNIISSISKKNPQTVNAGYPVDWEYLNKGFMIVYAHEDSTVLVPILKCNWEDKETGGMMYKTMNGNFSIEAKLSIKKRSNPLQEPDNGFQQAGIIVRSPDTIGENYLIYLLGTGGSDVPKYFLKRTTSSRTKMSVIKTGNLTGWLRIEKKGASFVVYKRANEGNDWIRVGEYEFDWLKKEVQVGLAVMARFVGDGPKQRPDMQAIFSNISIEKL